MCECMYNMTERDRMSKKVAVGAAEKGEGYSLERKRELPQDKDGLTNVDEVNVPSTNSSREILADTDAHVASSDRLGESKGSNHLIFLPARQDSQYAAFQQSLIVYT